MKYFKAKIPLEVPEKPPVEVTEIADMSVTNNGKSSLELFHEQNVLKKQELIDTVRDMHKNKYSIRSIAKELQLSRQTVTRYLNDEVTAIHGSYNVKRKSILDPYLAEINELMDKSVVSPVIEAKIRQNVMRVHPLPSEIICHAGKNCFNRLPPIAEH